MLRSVNLGNATRATRRALPVTLLLVIAGLLTATAPSLQASPLAQVEVAQAAFTARVNFTAAADSPIVSDPLNLGAGTYVNDYGQPFGNRGNNYTYGWSANLVGAGRVRTGTNSDKRLESFMHMQGAANPPVPGGFWELAVPDGPYIVTVGVGDGSNFDSLHAIKVEGQTAIAGFTPTAQNKWDAATVTATVSDGRLTITAEGGVNTKINYVVVQSQPSPARPYVNSVSPHHSQVMVLRSSAVSAEVRLLDYGAGKSAGVNETTLNSSTVQLWRVNNQNTKLAQITANVNTSGGGDVIVLQPTTPLDPTTRYLFQVTEGVKDLQGAAFLPFSSIFSTGTSGGNNNPNIVFDKVSLAPAQGYDFTTVVIGPDGKLYAGTLTGEVVRFPILQDGTLGAAQVINTIKNAAGNRFVIGMTFDGAANLWVSHNFAALSDLPDFTGKISRLSGAHLETYQDIVVNLPRSSGDHLSNSLAFGPDGALYMPQGSMSAMGEKDSTWGLRDEHLLTGTLLRIDPNKIAAPPLDVKTPDAGGSYNPYAPNAPVTIWASGIRNAYDSVFHSNGQLYVPANGSAAGGNTPATPASLPAACQSRVDGPYTAPAVPGITRVTVAQNDWLFRVAQNGYYGHPNPLRCEWVLNGGNPTSGANYAEVAQYPVGTQPDRNYKGAAFDFGPHFSPNGAIEYRSNANNGTLQGKLLVVRYSGGDDIIILTPNGPNGNVPQDTGWEVGNPGLTGFDDPLDIVEHTATGNLYVTELGARKITLLKPRTPPTGPQPSPTPSPIPSPGPGPGALPYKRTLPFIQR